MRKIIILIMILLCSTLTLAVKPTTQTFEGVQGLEIKYPILNPIKQNNDLTFHFHIFNISNGYNYRSGDTVNCTLHLYNSSGSHIYKAWDNVFHDIFDIEFKIGGGNFSRVGEYSYIIGCENNGLGGFSSVELFVTKDGREAPDSNRFYAVGLFFFGFCLVLLYIAFKLDIKHSILKVLIILITVYLQIYNGRILVLLTENTLINNIGLSIYKSLLLFVIIFSTYIGVYFIYEVLEYIGKLPGWAKRKNG